VGTSEPLAAASTELASFEGFLTENQARLFGSLCLMTGSRYEAEEIAQEAFVRVLERWDRVGYLDDPSGYLFITAMNVFRQRLRRAGIALRRSVGVAPAVDAFSPVEDREVVLDALARLALDQTGGARDHGAPLLLLGGSWTDARRSSLDDPSSSHEGSHHPSRPDRRGTMIDERELLEQAVRRFEPEPGLA
jgi:hypothetical protein